MAEHDGFLNIELALDKFNLEYETAGGEAKIVEEKLSRLRQFLVNSGVLFENEKENGHQIQPQKRRFSFGSHELRTPKLEEQPQDLFQAKEKKLSVQKVIHPVADSDMLRLALSRKAQDAKTNGEHCQELTVMLAGSRAEILMIKDLHEVTLQERNSLYEATLREKNSLNENLLHVQKEFEKLSTEYDTRSNDLTQEKEEQQALRSKHEQIKSQYETTLQEKNSVDEKLLCVQKEFEDLSTENDQLTNKSEEEKEEHQVLQSKHKQMISQYETTLQDKDSLSEKLMCIQKEFDDLYTEHNKCTRELKQETEERLSLESRHEQMKTQYETTLQDKDSLSEKFVGVQKEFEGISIKHDEMTDELKKEKEEQQSLQSKHEQMMSHYEAMLQEKIHLYEKSLQAESSLTEKLLLVQKDFDALTTANNKCSNELEQEKGERHTLQSIFDRLQEENHSTISQLATAQESKNKLQTDFDAANEEMHRNTLKLSGVQDEKRKMEFEQKEDRECLAFEKKKSERLQKTIDEMQEELDKKIEKQRLTVVKLEKTEDTLEVETSARIAGEKEVAELKITVRDLKEAAKSSKQQIEDIQNEIIILQSSLRSSEDDCNVSKKKIQTLLEECQALAADLDDTTVTLQTSEEGLQEAGKENSGLLCQVEALKVQVNQVADAKNIYASKAAQAKQDIELLEREQNEMLASVAAYRVAAEAAQNMLKSLEANLNVALGDEKTISLSGKSTNVDLQQSDNSDAIVEMRSEQSDIQVVVDKEETQPSFDGDMTEGPSIHVEACVHTSKKMEAIIDILGKRLQSLTDQKSHLLTVVRNKTETIEKAECHIDDLKSILVSARSDNQKSLRDLDYESTKRKDLEKMVENLSENQKTVQQSYQMTAKENFGLREKLVALREARAEKCINLDQELSKVRDAFRFLEREIYTESILGLGCTALHEAEPEECEGSAITDDTVLETSPTDEADYKDANGDELDVEEREVMDVDGEKEKAKGSEVEDEEAVDQCVDKSIGPIASYRPWGNIFS